MKRLKLATAVTASALLFSFATPGVQAQETAVTTSVATKAVTQLPINGKIRTSLASSKTHTYAIQVKNNELIELSATLYDSQTGDDFLIMPDEGASFVLKNDKGEVVQQSKFGDLVGDSSYALFITAEAMKPGNYTIEFTPAFNDSKSFIEFKYLFQAGLEMDEEPIAPPITTTPSTPGQTTPSTPAPSTPAPSTPDQTTPSTPAPSTPETTPSTDAPATTPETTPTESETPTPAPYKKASNLMVKLSKAKVKPKAKVTVTNKAKGTSIKYKVAIKEKGGKNKIIQNYSTKKKTTFKAPTKKGTYTVTVYAKSSKGGKVIHKTKKLTVK
ncbi:hypothetical protein [Kurthia massiliensis]|uniref:hypothetical protein n=1 Tax=Kurthia massiliensis TaxID=1033739 RepID=UPI000287D7FB|nr:hypothetical protein [Kurthia massiliensis]